MLKFTVDGEERTVTRREDATAEIYSVDVGAEAIAAEQQVVISFEYVCRAAQAGHVVRFDVDRPTRGLAVEMNYDDVGIARMRMFDYMPGSPEYRTFEESSSPNGRRLRFTHDGWLFPRSGLLFVWTLDSELKGAAGNDNARRASGHDGRR